MLRERSMDEILPYAGITLTRFTGIISASCEAPRERCKLKPFKSKAKNCCKNRKENIYGGL